MSKKNIYIIGGAVVAILALYFLTRGGSEDGENAPIEAIVAQGDFIIEVNTTGELEAISSVEIYASPSLRKMGINNIKIADIVAEGTLLKEGDYVAKLDPSELATAMRNLETELEQKQSDLRAAKLDTSLTLRKEREDLRNLKEQLEESELEVEQSQFEPPATQRKVQIARDRSERKYFQAEDGMSLKIQQAEAKVFKVQTEVIQKDRKVSDMQAQLAGLTITAPKPGMLTYIREWNGNKVQTGSSINLWNPRVANIPDLSGMISKTFVNEIDISKVTKDQLVDISVDAFPDLSFSGIVTDVANIGQDEKGTDAKVFEVRVILNEMDSVLRPAMTTTNKIKVKSYTDVLSLPIEAVYSNDSIQFVYKKEGSSTVRKQVLTGDSNATHIIISKGLAAGDAVYIIPRKEDEEAEIEYLEK